MLEAWQFSPLQPACKGPPLPERYLGRQLGKYRVIRLLGAGAFAWVYEAVDLDLEIPVALKILRPEYAGVANAETRFRREATTAARLRHPNIVTVRDVGQAEGASFVAMDLLPVSLARRLDVLQRLPEPEVVRMALDVAAALSIAHTDGVVHRDIKPDNVLLGSNGESIVADFGLAAAFTDQHGESVDLSDPNQVMGTPHYFSPEQARGLDLDGRTDLYALGVTCYRAATGRLPFEGDDWYEVAKQHIENEAIPPRQLVPELSEEFEAIILKLLAKNPDDRFASATKLVDALLALPSAPVSRNLSLSLLQSSGAAITQIASPYHGVALIPAKRTLRRNVLVSGATVVTLAAVALFAFPSVLNIKWQRLFGDTVQPVATTKTDTLPVVQPIAPTVTPDTGKTIAVPATIDVRKPVIAPKKSLAPRTVHVELTAPDSAELSVNDQVVGHGKWSGDLSAGRHRFRASLEGNTASCASLRHDSTATIAGEKANQIVLDVAGCSVLMLKVIPNDAEFTISADTTARFPFMPQKARSAGRPIPFVLRNGLYRIDAKAERCSNYGDTVTVKHNATTNSDTVSRTITMLC
ncbi:MAG: serine/threonine-protein kinase [Gemmatimonadaceae bacterium]